MMMFLKGEFHSFFTFLHYSVDVNKVIHSAVEKSSAIKCQTMPFISQFTNSGV